MVREIHPALLFLFPMIIEQFSDFGDFKKRRFLRFLSRFYFRISKYLDVKHGDKKLFKTS